MMSSYCSGFHHHHHHHHYIIIIIIIIIIRKLTHVAIHRLHLQRKGLRKKGAADAGDTCDMYGIPVLPQSSSLSSSDYLFPSTRLARGFPDIFESAVILCYQSCIPGIIIIIIIINTIIIIIIIITIIRGCQPQVVIQ